MAGFGAGATFAYLSGMAASPQAAFSSGVIMALVQGAFFKARPPVCWPGLQIALDVSGVQLTCMTSAHGLRRRAGCP